MNRRLPIVVLASALAGGCILEDNPDFVESGGDSEASGTESTSGPTTSDTTTGMTGDPTSAGTDSTSGSDSDTGPPIPIGAGCDEPECPEIHIGIDDLDCDRMVDGVLVQACDHSGPWSLRVAAADAEFQGGAIIYMHDRGGDAAEYIGVVNVPGHTTISAAPDTAARNVRVVFDDDPQDEHDLLRLTGDDIYLHDFVLLGESGVGQAIRFRRVNDEPGTETEDHLIERLEIIAIVPEEVGANSTQPPFLPIGAGTVIRNCYIWGYWEAGVQLRFARGFRFYNNTWIGYQRTGTLFDVTSTDDIEISNNVLISLTREETAVVLGDVATSGLKMAGNVIEGFSNVGVGLPNDTSIVVENNTLGEAPLLAPSSPILLADAAVTADTGAANGGRSFDDVDIAEATEVLPGAFQNRSTATLPRSTTVTAGSGQCGSSQCDVDVLIENALQEAVWRTWPGGTLELHPATFQQAVVTWPIEIAGTDYDQVVIERSGPTGFLGDHNMWAAHTSVLRVNFGMGAPMHIHDVTIAVGPDQEGLVVEGAMTNAPPTPHLFERLQIVDRGDTNNDLADAGAWLGHNAILRDSLIVGGFQRCIMHGVRGSSSQATPETTNFVYNVTCRLTKIVSGQPLIVMAVAGAVGSQWFNMAVDLAEPGTMFLAQRRVSSTNPNLDVDLRALDYPTSFDATNWVIRNGDTMFDGFTAMDGTYGVTPIVDVMANDPFFVSPTDSHLDVGADGIDTGVAPSSIDPTLDLGTTLDGVDRNGRVIDHGAYEQGM